MTHDPAPRTRFTGSRARSGPCGAPHPGTARGAGTVCPRTGSEPAPHSGHLARAAPSVPPEVARSAQTHLHGSFVPHCSRSSLAGTTALAGHALPAPLRVRRPARDQHRRCPLLGRMRIPSRHARAPGSCSPSPGRVLRACEPGTTTPGDSAAGPPPPPTAPRRPVTSAGTALSPAARPSPGAGERDPSSAHCRFVVPTVSPGRKRCPGLETNRNTQDRWTPAWVPLSALHLPPRTQKVYSTGKGAGVILSPQNTGRKQRAAHTRAKWVPAPSR